MRKIERENRPVLHLKRTPFENALDILALLLFMGSVVYILVNWPSLPDRIPTHYTLFGEVDQWGSKGMIFFLSIIGSLLWIGLSLLEKYPHTYNYMSSITEENAERQYKNGRLAINVLKNETLAYFAYCNYQDVQVAYGRDVVLGTWDLLVFLVVLFGSIGFFIIRSFRLR